MKLSTKGDVMLCIGYERLLSNIEEIKFAGKSQDLIFVSGLINLRQKNNTTEVLLVKGDKKPFWQFPGGKVNVNEDHFSALERELKEELGYEVQLASYAGTYVHNLNNASTTLSVHSFVNISNINTVELTPGDDVSHLCWVPILHVEEKLSALSCTVMLTQQTSIILQGIGANVNGILTFGGFDTEAKMYQ